MEHGYIFTVFTPCYNMGASLNRVYESLCRQTFRDFEWIVVDDGSTDDTVALVSRWQAEANFPIRYVYQENAGKHIARNKALTLARGELFSTMDADDEFLGNALHVFYNAWQQIPNKRDYSGMACPCLDGQTHEVIGKKFPRAVFDSNDMEAKYVLGLWGEKWGACRTAVLREFPFPDVPGQRYIAESFVWNQIAARYTHRYINVPLRIYHRETPGSLTKISPAFRFPLSAYESHLLEVNIAYKYLRRDKRLLAQKLIGLGRFGAHAKIGPWQTLRRLDSWSRRTLFLCAMPVSLAYFLRDRAKARVPT